MRQCQISPLTTHHSPLTTHHLPLTTHHLPLTTHPLVRIAIWGILLGLSTVLGCSEVPSARPPVEAAPSPGQEFKATTAGTVRGRVVWQSDPPRAVPLPRYRRLTGQGKTESASVAWPNPHALSLDPKTGGVKNAVVFLRGVDPLRSRPWDLPPVRILQRGRQLHVCQGPEEGIIGFVRQGDPIQMVSEDPFFHSLHADGAAFFTLAFPDPGRPRVRLLQDKGRVELTSAAGFFWMRGHLFVDDHPYYTRTDSAGEFVLPGVPPGNYEVVCWLPNWRVQRSERDPESGQVARIFFNPPLEQIRSLTLPPAGSVEVILRMKDEG